MLTVNNINTRKKGGICSKLTTEIFCSSSNETLNFVFINRYSLSMPHGNINKP